jgi:acetyl esterase
VPLDPQIAALLGPPQPGFEMSALPVDVLRQYVRETSIAFPPLAVRLAGVADRTIPGPAGELRCRVYSPVAEPPFPVIVYFHGGGWVVGDLDTQDMICRALCHGADAVVLSVDYRLAPEHKFPAAVDDAFAATRWAARHAGELGGDAARLAVAGDSAGGGLAAAVALRARDEGGPPLRAQLVFYASCNHPSERTASAREFADGPILTETAIDYFWTQYLRDRATDQHHPWASPIRAASHRDLPPAFVASAELDPTRDDCEAYGAKLAAAGVVTESRRYPGAPHGFVSWVGLADVAQRAIDDACAFVTRHVDPRREP